MDKKKSKVIKRIDVTRNSGRIFCLVFIRLCWSTLPIQRPQYVQ